MTQASLDDIRIRFFRCLAFVALFACIVFTYRYLSGDDPRHVEVGPCSSSGTCNKAIYHTHDTKRVRKVGHGLKRMV